MQSFEFISRRFDWSSYELGKSLEVACDGASKGNPGVAGWGWYSNSDLLGFGGVMAGTNNAMELKALESALSSIPQGVNIVFYLDSKYVIDIFTKYIFGWRKNGYLTAKGDGIKNKDIVIRIDSLLKARTGSHEFIWVKGHAGHALNEEADRLANRGVIEVQKNR